jgi:hypothetical protein
MADRKISDLTALTTPASGDYLPIVDISEAAAASKNKRITIEELMRGVPNGTAAAPGIAFETDPNTGIYSPGADQLAVATNGTGRLFVASSGNVGVGAAVSSPGRILHVDSASTSNSYIRFTNSNSTGNGAEVGLFDSGAANPSLVLSNSMSDGNVLIYTNGNERLRVTETGKIGIGVSAPQAKLHILDPTASAVELMRLQANLNSPSGNKSITWADATDVVGRISVDYTTPTAKMRFGSLYNSGYQTSDLMTLTPTGLGIGTSAPGSVLDVRFPTSPVANNGTGINALRVFTTASLAANAGGAIALGGESTAAGGVYASYGQIAGRKENATSDNYAGYLQFAVNGSGGTMSERLRITSGGNVGIGTTSPSHALDVVSTANSDRYVRFSNDGTSGGALAIGTLYNVGGANVGSIRATGSTWTYGNQGPNRLSIISAKSNGVELRTAAAPIVFSNGNANAEFSTERGRYDNGGRLLIGTSTARSNFFNLTTVAPNFQLEGAGDARRFAITSCEASAAGSQILLTHQRSGTVGGNTVLIANDETGSIRFMGSDGSELVESAKIVGEVDNTPGANDMPGRLVFSTTADGAASPTERLRINSVGQTMVNSAGTAAAPVISKVDDTNTGIFFPAADTIAFAEGGAEAARIDSSGRLLVGTSSVSGLAAAKTVVVETTAAAVQRLIGNTAAQGSAQKITVVRYYPIISLGTKLIIPFVSQVSANTVTLCKVTGLRNQFNSNSPLPFEINFAVGHTNALFNLSSYGGQGNFASIAASGLNVEITFTTAYASGGIIVCIEYLTASPLSSIDVPNIAMN